jgi:hypothetical protein
MQSFLVTLGFGVIALLVVAVLVAWWEHFRRTQLSKTNDVVIPAPPQRAAHVDLDLDALPPAAAALDQAERKATVDAAMARMVRGANATGSSAWTETRPMVGPGVTREREIQPLTAERQN